MPMRTLAKRAAVSWLLMVALLSAGLAAGFGHTIIYRRVWVEPPPASGMVIGGPAANNSPSLQHQIAAAVRQHR